jgi:MFS transporter, OFA family, oxalate/formate antiporter
MADDVKVFGMPAASGRWLMVLVGLVIQLCLGAIYAYGVVRVPITAYFKSLGLNPTAMDMTWPFVTFLLCFAIAMPLAGPYFRKWGPKRCPWLEEYLLESPGLQHLLLHPHLC